MIETHTGCDYWVTGVGFVPGAFMSYAMDPGKRFGAPLYRTPRTWTHARLLNFGGLTSTIYPIRVPGGGQLFGRTPIEIFDPQERSSAFADARCSPAPATVTAMNRSRARNTTRFRGAGGGRHLRVPGRGGHLRLRGLCGLGLRRSGSPRRSATPRARGGRPDARSDPWRLRTTVQDMGRRGGQALGIPPSGAQDGFALRMPICSSATRREARSWCARTRARPALR